MRIIRHAIKPEGVDAIIAGDEGIFGEVMNVADDTIEFGNFRCMSLVFAGDNCVDSEFFGYACGLDRKSVV